MQDFEELSCLQVDALTEIGNIGAGNAATALAQLVQAKIDMNVPEVNILPFDDVAGLVGGSDKPVVGLFFRVSGSISASIIFMIPVTKAYLLVDMLLGRKMGETQEEQAGELEHSALMEVGNIVSATYLNALSHFTKLTMVTSVPALAQDMAGAILNGILAQVGSSVDNVLVLKTMFTKEENDVVGHFLLLPESESLNILLSALGVKF